MGLQLGRGVRLGRGVQLGRFASAAATQWNPLVYFGADLVAWFDLQDAAAFTVTSGAVSAITNKASGTSWTQGTSGSRPTYSATGFNGFPCMTLDGIDDTIISTEAAVVSAMANNTASTVFVVASSVVTDDATAVWGSGNSGFSSSRTRRYGLNTGGAGQWAIIAVDDAGTGVNLVSTSGLTNTNPNVLEFFSSTSVATVLVNGTSVGADAAAFAPSTTTPNRCALGSRPDSAPDQFWNGSIAEVVVFNRELNAFERAVVRTYLLRKWGIADPTPLTILGSLAWWVRADTGITIATGVSQWNDLSGNGRNFTQGTTGAQPTVVSNAINGHPAVRGDGADDYLRTTLSRSAPGTQPFYVWAIVRQVSWASNDSILGDYSGATGFIVFQGISGTSNALYCGTSTLSNVGATTGNFYRVEGQFTNSTSGIRSGNRVLTRSAPAS